MPRCKPRKIDASVPDAHGKTDEMNANEFVSIVLPARNVRYLIAQRIERVLDAMRRISRSRFEVVVVDDGSQDQTVETVQEIESQNSAVRLIRHSRPRGIEAAGQTGLERACGELVFIQESNRAIRIDDFHRLIQLSADQSILAARAQSTQQPLPPPLLRTFKAWGTDAEQQFRRNDGTEYSSGLQMIRRPHLKKLRSPLGAKFQLLKETAIDTVDKTSH
ncbi:glycosyltransferase family 2 protein [Stieleria marina]